eukprot:7481697-Pyramimonas_sp.AAC.1
MHVEKRIVLPARPSEPTDETSSSVVRRRLLRASSRIALAGACVRSDASRRLPHPIQRFWAGRARLALNVSQCGEKRQRSARSAFVR